MFEIPTFEEYSMSSRFGPVEGLPSQKKYPLKLPENLYYKPRGQVCVLLSKENHPQGRIKGVSISALDTPLHHTYLADDVIRFYC